MKLNVFNYFEEKSKVALHKYEKAVERNNEIILHFATHPRHRRCFPSPNPNLQPKTIFVDMSWMLKFPINLVLVLHLKFYTYFLD
jgi:hypothetical protein